MERGLTKLFITVVTLAAMVGCAGEPSWVSKGGAAFSEKDQAKYYYAIGVAEPNANTAMQLKMAETGARVQLASNMNSYVANMVKDFMQTHKDYCDPDSASSIQFVQSISRSITDADIIGAQQVDSYKNDKGVLYVLYRLDRAEATAKANKTIMAKAREQQANLFKAKAEEALKELDAELEKKRQRDMEVAK